MPSIALLPTLQFLGLLLCLNWSTEVEQVKMVCSVRHQASLTKIEVSASATYSGRQKLGVLCPRGEPPVDSERD